jgi:RNAse (barnase) inhibitor barstar
MADDDLRETLCHAPDNGVYRLPVAGSAAIGQVATGSGLAFHVVQLADCADDATALAAIGKAMGFPECFGGNLDALYDCLTDLSWQDTAATVIVLTGCAALIAAQPARWAALLDVFAAAAGYWRDEETPFRVFVDLPAEQPPAAPAPDR